MAPDPGRLSTPPGVKGIRRIGTERPERRRVKPEGVQDLGRPERDDGMGLTLEHPQAEARRDRVREVRAFGVEAAGGRLDVRESRPILDVQQRAALAIPGDDIGPACELKVLIRLVDADAEPEPTQMGHFQLAHRRVHDVGRLAQVRALSRVHHADPDLEGECPRGPHCEF